VPVPGSFLRTIRQPRDVLTVIPTGSLFPESLAVAESAYAQDITLFQKLAASSASSAHLLEQIRTPGAFYADQRMSLLKLFRRCVSAACDTETTKKITKVTTAELIRSFGDTFKDIDTLNSQFASADTKKITATLSALLAESDTRGQSGYLLTGEFFDWFESNLGTEFEIRGPRGAGKDVELSTVFPEFKGSYPCDFVITSRRNQSVRAIGFARYDATRGGSQSDDRTGGNETKVLKAQRLCVDTHHRFRMIFLADGPGLAHGDTWEEACALDGSWNDNVRVTTLKLAQQRITADWIRG
jgi:hypothetical protein